MISLTKEVIKFISLLFLTLTATILLLLAKYPSWENHLQVDISIFYSRAYFFLTNLNLHGIQNNEYQPMALLFFVFLSPILLIQNSVDAYILAFLFINCLLIFILAYLYVKMSNQRSLFVYSLILLFTGPIILYRFELLVTTFVILSFYFWKQRKFSWSAIFLAIATLTKVYPIILLPYFMIKLSTQKFSKSITYLATYMVTVIVFLLLFFAIFQINFSDLNNALSYHAQKSISFESSWAIVVTLLNMITTGNPPPLETHHRMWAIDRNFIFAPLWFYNFFWILPVGFLYVKFLKHNRSNENLDINFLLLLILTLLTTSKVFAPQYLIWYMLLIPLINTNVLLSNKSWVLSFFLILLITFLTQIIYPLFFSNFIEFFLAGQSIQFFFLNGIRNLLMVVLFFVLYRNFVKVKSTDR